MTSRSTVPAKSLTTKEELVAAYAVIVGHLKANTSDKSAHANFEGTELRAAKALLETCLSEADIQEQLTHIIDRVFPVDVSDKEREGMISQGPIRINSCCPHHLFPVRYEAYVSYLPKDGQVLGLSKLARIAQLLGRRPVLHEQLASDIADVLHKPAKERAFSGLESDGSAVMLNGVHTCMACRGVEADAITSIVELRGNFWTADFEQKFYQAVNAIKTSKPF